MLFQYAVIGCILFVRLPLLFLADFVDIESVFFWASHGKTADLKASKPSASKAGRFADFAEISDYRI